MQTSLEFTYCSIFTLKYTVIESKIGILLNVTYAVNFLVLTFMFPLICLLYLKHFEMISEEKL